MVRERLTIPSIFLYATGRFSNPAAFLERAGDIFEPISTAEFREMVMDLSLGLSAAGVKKGDPVAILSANRVEWAAADLAIACSGGVSVPLSPLYSHSQLAYVLQDAGITRAFVSTIEMAATVRLLLGARETDPAIFLIEGSPEGDGIISLGELVSLGRKQYHRKEERFLKSALSVIGDDLSTIMYTSGTSGKPKGVRLSHRNITSNVIATSDALEVTPDDRCLSFLPLSHAFERTAGFLTIFYNGAAIAYAESVQTVARDIRDASPTILISVPRLYEKIEQSTLDQADTLGRPGKAVFSWAIDLAKRSAGFLSKQEKLPISTRLGRSFADFLVYRKIRDRLGGRVRMLISGGAPLDVEIAEMFLGCGMLILEGYGLTEASPICTVNRLESFKFGSVGLPLQGVDLRIDEDGEVLVKGTNVMMGYQNPEQEAGKTVQNGWLSTGDTGFLDTEGFLHLTGRKKELIITSWGMNVAPIPIEQRIKRSPFIRDVALVGNNRPFIGALVVPEFDRVASRLDRAVTGKEDRRKLIHDPDVIAFIQDEITGLCSHLSQKEHVKKCVLLPRDFSLDSGELTTTLKLVRPVIYKNFQREINSLYGRGQTPSS